MDFPRIHFKEISLRNKTFLSKLKIRNWFLPLNFDTQLWYAEVAWISFMIQAISMQTQFFVYKGSLCRKSTIPFYSKIPLSGVNFNHALMQVEIHQHLSKMYFTVNNFLGWGWKGGRVAVVGIRNWNKIYIYCITSS